MNTPRHPLFKALALLAALAVLVAMFGYARFAIRRFRVYEVGDVNGIVRAAAADDGARVRGEHLARTLGGCAECHGADFGGRLMSDEPVLHLIAPNLTPGLGSVTRRYQDGDWVRAIVHGVNPDGRSLVVMPSKELASLSDPDVASIVAFMKTLPPVDRELDRARVTVLGSVVFGLTGAPVLSAEKIDHLGARLPAPEASASRAYGEYLTGVCRGCHGADLHGGIVLHPGSPPSADISSQAMASWDFAAFERVLRTGVGRDGQPVDDAMPWRAMRELSPDELRALWLGLRQD